MSSPAPHCRLFRDYLLAVVKSFTVIALVTDGPSPQRTHDLDAKRTVLSTSSSRPGTRTGRGAQSTWAAFEAGVAPQAERRWRTGRWADMDINITTISRPRTRAEIEPFADGDAWLAGVASLFSEPQTRVRRLVNLLDCGWGTNRREGESRPTITLRGFQNLMIELGDSSISTCALASESVNCRTDEMNVVQLKLA
jgi:hypothetical protein